MFLKNHLSLILFASLFSLLLLFNFSHLNHPATEFDEGVYLTTFQLVNAGYPLYQQTFFSQFPGFFIAINPLFTLFGQTLQAGRIGVAGWSLMGILTIMWIGYELELPLFSLLAIAALYSLPLYTTEILTFHADALPGVFSLIAFAALLRFRKTQDKLWLILSACALALAVLIKLDSTVIPSLCLLLVTMRKNKLKIVITNGLLFIITFVLCLLLTTIPFGISAILHTVIPFRTLVTLHSAFNPDTFFMLLTTQTTLVVLLLAGIVITTISMGMKYGDRIIYIAFFSWLITTCIVLFLYHPLFLHHLFLLTIPAALLFSYATSVVINIWQKTKQLFLIIWALFYIFLSYQTYLGFSRSQHIEVNNEDVAIQIVQQKTKISDFVVSDDGIINGVTKRLSPPNLSDLSFVRLQSGDITPESFEKTLALYHPKLILSWAQRLQTLPNFDTILKRNHYKLIYQNQEQQIIYQKQPQWQVIRKNTFQADTERRIGKSKRPQVFQS